MTRSERMVVAGGNSIFAARANKKTAGIIAAYPKKIESGKELKSIQGIGKGSQDKVRLRTHAQRESPDTKCPRCSSTADDI